MSYLEKLKSKTRLPHELPKLPKGKNSKNMATPRTALTALTTFGSKDSTPSRLISETQNKTRLVELVRELDSDRAMLLDEFNRLGEESLRIMAGLPGATVAEIFERRAICNE